MRVRLLKSIEWDGKQMKAFVGSVGSLIHNQGYVNDTVVVNFDAKNAWSPTSGFMGGDVNINIANLELIPE